MAKNNLKCRLKETCFFDTLGFMKIVFTGGGTAGHIFPGIAIIEELQKHIKEHTESLELFWIGSKKENEKKMVTAYHIPFYSIPTGKFRRYFSLQNVIDIFKIIAGIIKSLYLLLKLKPDLIFSKGGFVAVPPCVAAKLLHIPICIHESDFSPGLTTKLTSKFAHTIFLSYEKTIDQFPENLKPRCIVTGTPVRNIFYTASAENGRNFLKVAQQKILLVIGGSLGAQHINNLIKETCVFLTSNFFVVHQLGKANFETSAEIQRRLETEAPEQLRNYAPFEFITDEMADVLACSELVVSRAGANSLWEIISMHKPAILIPLSLNSSRGDQIENAEYFASKNCVAVLPEEQATSQAFREMITELLENPKRLFDMTEASKKMTVNQASSMIASEVYRIIKNILSQKNNNVSKNRK